MFNGSKPKNKAIPAKILIVDDEPDCISIIQCRLEWCHYQVITATNGEEGLQTAEKEKPDMILLDTNMPVMNGQEMLERLNPILRGWHAYHTTVQPEPKRLRKLNCFIRERLRIFLKRKHSDPSRGGRRVHGNLLARLGLFQFGGLQCFNGNGC